MHLRILPDHQNHGLKKKYFFRSEVVKKVFWCICASFQDIFNVWSGSKRVLMHLRKFSRPPKSWPENKKFLGLTWLKKVLWCICAYFQTTRIKAWKKTLQPFFTTDRLLNQGGGVGDGLDNKRMFYCFPMFVILSNKCLDLLYKYFIYFSGSFEFGAARRLE